MTWGRFIIKPAAPLLSFSLACPVDLSKRAGSCPLNRGLETVTAELNLERNLGSSVMVQDVIAILWD